MNDLMRVSTMVESAKLRIYAVLRALCAGLPLTVAGFFSARGSRCHESAAERISPATDSVGAFMHRYCTLIRQHATYRAADHHW